jgi:hypothetical protein
VSEIYKTIGNFKKAVRNAIALRTFVHYDETRGCVMLVTDASSGDDGLEVRRPRTPDRRLNCEWYKFAVDRRDA